MKRLLIAVALASMATAAQAELVLEGSTVVTTPGVYPNGTPDVNEAGYTSGILNGSLFANEAGTVSFTYLGAEATHLNLSLLNDNTGSVAGVLNNQGDSVGTTVSANYDANSYINFTFTDVTHGNSSINSITKNPPSWANLAYAVFNPTQGAGTFANQGYSYIIGFDDAAGTKDYADLMVGVKFIPAAVPEADTYAMMLAGLGLLGFAARRRKQA